MNSSLSDQLGLATALLGLASFLAYLGYRAVTGYIEKKLSAPGGAGNAIGWLVAAGILAALTGYNIMLMLASPDPAMRKIMAAVFILVALGLSAGITWRWSGRHRHPAVRAYLSAILRNLASRAALASLLAIIVLVTAWTRTETAGLAGFLTSTFGYLACWTAVFTAKFGWWPLPYKGRLYILVSPLRPRLGFWPAFRIASSEFLALTPRARGTLKGSYLAVLATSLLMSFALFLPLAILNRAAIHPGPAKAAWNFVIGMISGSIFMVMLPVMLLAGFAFAFILLPIGALRGAAAPMSGGAGAGGRI